MDVAKSLGLFREQSPEQWLRTANRVLPPVVMALLLLAIAYRLAELTWALVPHHAFDRPSPRIVQPAGDEGRSAADFSALEDSHLFGEATVEAEPDEPVTSELDAPETTLPLTLTGVTADENGKLSRAHIVSGRAEQRTYAIGDEIENAGGAKLHAVYGDRVIINRGGQLETLRFDETRTASTASRISRPSPPPPPPAQDPYPDPALRDVVTENSASLTHVFRIAPHTEGGQIVGFRLNPGRERELFDALGLMPGDVVTEINGVVLDAPDKALRVFEALGESTQASVTLIRDGVPNVLVIDTTQLQSMMNERQ